MTPLSRRFWTLLGAVMLSGLATARMDAADPATNPDPLRRDCEHGITLALRGETAGAESVFIAVLSRSPGDSRALTNLGNLHVLTGDLRVAVVFYDRARIADSLDAGIALNRGTAHLLMGEEEMARQDASLGIRLAGGENEAARLLGLAVADSSSPAGKASDRTFLSKEELAGLLSDATRRIPAKVAAAPDTSRADSTLATDPDVTAKRPPTWRSAGSRAADAHDAAVLLYWKK